MCVQPNMDSLIVSNLSVQNRMPASKASDSGVVPTMDGPCGQIEYSILPTRSYRLCRHFARGKCTWGTSCRFSHDAETAVQNGTWMYPTMKHNMPSTHAKRTDYGHESTTYIPDMINSGHPYSNAMDQGHTTLPTNHTYGNMNCLNYMGQCTYQSNGSQYDSPMYSPTYHPQATHGSQQPSTYSNTISMQYPTESSYTPQQVLGSKDNTLDTRSVQVQRWQHEPYAYTTPLCLNPEVKHGNMDSIGSLEPPPFANAQQ